jgi:glycosyltransferase involved in cell wall biosynthesis
VAAEGLRVCLIGDGSSVHLRRWSADLAAGGCEVALVSHGPAAPIDGVTVHRARPAPPIVRQLVSATDVRRFLRRFDPAIVHMHFLPYGPRALWPLGIGRLVLTPYGTDVETTPPGWRGAAARLTLDRLLRSAHGIVTASEHTMAVTLARGAMRGDVATEVIGFGVDCATFHPPAGASVAGVDGPVMIGYAKALLEYYGPLDLIGAVARLRDRGRAVRLRLAGRGPLEGEVRRRIDRLDLASAVELAGHIPQPELPAFYAGIDIFAMPSHRESYGVAALEASATGVPVVASRVGGIPEVVIDGATGILVPPRDPGALAEGLDRLVRDGGLRATLGRRGRDEACRHHARDAAVGRMIAFYRRIAGA